MATKERTVVDWRTPGRRHSEVRLKAQTSARRRVLVVDDEPLIRAFVARALRAAGYDVLEAGSAERATELLAQEGGSLSLLLSDVGLPGASGAELVEHAQRALPSLPTQLMSATPKHRLVSEGVLANSVDLLQKPFEVAELLQRVEELAAPAAAVGASVAPAPPRAQAR